MIKVLDFNGQEKGTKQEPEFISNYNINKHVIWEVVTAELSNLRQGTHKTKTRTYVRGGGKKPWRQKGTGHARSGSNRSPVWVGGGTIFGPLPRDYRKKITRKKKKAGYVNIIAQKIQQNELVILDSIDLQDVKTKEAFAGLNKVIKSSSFYEKYSENKKIRENSNKNHRTVTLVVKDEASKKAFRNIPWINYISIDRISARALFYNHGIIVTSDAFDELMKKVSLNKEV